MILVFLLSDRNKATREQWLYYRSIECVGIKRFSKLLECESIFENVTKVPF
jgi:hypothetical protein